jgi:hypothetical protein
MPVNYCHNCGKKAPSVSCKFCPECGTNLASLSSSPPKPEEKLKKLKTFAPKILAFNNKGKQYEEIDADDGESVEQFTTELTGLEFETDINSSPPIKETLKQIMASPCPTSQAYPTEPQKFEYDEKTFRAEFLKEAGTTRDSKDINGD